MRVTQSINYFIPSFIEIKLTFNSACLHDISTLNHVKSSFSSFFPYYLDKRDSFI